MRYYYYVENNKELVDELVKEKWLKTPDIVAAFKAVHRDDFVPENIKNKAFLNTALSLGWGQTISQPLVVAFMMELLAPQKNSKILEIGFGSGWQTCLLAHIVTQGSGRVFAVELVQELCTFGIKNISKYGFLKKGTVRCFCQNAGNGLEENAPYDRIIAAASAKNNIPGAWREQLNKGGRIVAPVDNSIWLFIKKSDDEWEEKEFPGFVFVPLV